MLSVALKIQHDVHHVFQHTRSGNRALLGHMPDEKNRASRRLCHAHQQAGAFAHLRNAARRARHVRTIHRLNGINNHIIRRKLFPAAFGGVHRVFAQHKQIFALDAQPPRTHFDLPHGFLARNIQNTRSSRCQMLRRLKQKRRFADARVASDQHQRTFHYTSTQYAIQLSNAGRCARGRFFRHLGKAHGARSRAGPLLDCLNRRGLCSLRCLLLQRVPCVAAGTFAHPARRFIAARAAYIDCLFLCHARPPRYQRSFAAQPCVR